MQSVAPGPHTSKPEPEHKVYPYLLHDVEIVRPCQVFSTDITYIRLRHGFVYLMAIIDWYSRFVLDWQLSINMEADFCIETLSRVLAHTRCDIFNTDQGAQVTSTGFTDVLKEHNISISMDGRGRWVDNVFVERRLLNHKMNNDVTSGYLIIDVERLRKPMQQVTDFLLKSMEIKEKVVIFLNKEVSNQLSTMCRWFNQGTLVE